MSNSATQSDPEYALEIQEEEAATATEEEKSSEQVSERPQVRCRSTLEYVLQAPPSPPHYTWVRPFMQSYPGRINQYVCTEVLGEVISCLEGYGCLDTFREGCFGHLLHLRKGESANNALHHLMARKLYDPSLSSFERWFYVGGTNIRFGMLEYALVTGLHFGSCTFNPNVGHDIPETGIYYRFFGGRKTTVIKLHNRFTRCQWGSSKLQRRREK